LSREKLARIEGMAGKKGHSLYYKND